MLDSATLATLVSTTVTTLTPLLKLAADAGVQEVGKLSAGALFERLKSRFLGPGVAGALVDLQSEPDDPDTQAALRHQLKKTVEADETSADFLKSWILDAREVCNAGQVASVAGNANKVAQIGSGSNNSVNQ